MSTLRHAVACAFGIAALVCPWARGQDADTEALVRAHLGSFVEAGAVPGIATGVIKDGHTTFVGLGRTVAGAGEPVEPQTLFEIGSITKTFTATLLAEAHARGELGIDDPLSAHLPHGVRPPAKDGVEITLAMLAGHTSGLPRMPANLVADGLDNPYADYDEDDLFAFIGAFEPTSAPGRGEAEYSNLGPGLLGTLLALDAGSTYEALIAARITGPLGMTDTVIVRSDDQRARSASPHQSGGRPSTNWTFDALAGAGALWSTTADMLVYARAQIDPASTPLASALPLTHAPRAAMKGSPASVGLGWIIAGDGRTLVHDGGTNGYRSSLLVDPRSGLVVAVLANAAEDRLGAAAERLFQALAGMDVAPVLIEKPAAVDDAGLDRLVGTYTSPLAGAYVITREGLRLMAKLGPQPAFEVFPASPAEFTYRVVEARIVFDLPAQGPATAVTLYQNGAELRFERTGE